MTLLIVGATHEVVDHVDCHLKFQVVKAGMMQKL